MHQIFKYIFARNFFAKSLIILLLLLLPASTYAEGAISLAPSITEIIYSIEADRDLIAVTTYCDYPPAAKSLPKVGGFADLNIEALVRLKPSVVFGMPEHEFLRKGLESFGVTLQLYRQGSLGEIYNSIEGIGETLGKVHEAQNLVSSMRLGVSALRREYKDKPLVLVSVGREPNSVDSVYAAGIPTIYNELVETAGGENVQTSRIEYAKITAEGLMQLNPEVILDLQPNQTGSKKAWSSLSSLRAVKEGQVYVLTEEFVVNPGPRIVKTLELFQKAIAQSRSTSLQPREQANP